MNFIGAEAGVIADRRAFFVSRLLEWRERNPRLFPWRKEERNPYRVLIAEILLQRTRRDKVEEIYLEFVKRFPTPEALMKAEVDELKRIVYPLGLAHRIPRLRELGRALVERHRGVVPGNYDELLSLPGVGPYIASAILCFGFKRDVLPIDANVARLVMRFFGYKPRTRRAHSDPELRSFIASLVPKRKAKALAEAMLDLGAELCLPRKPRCAECPLASDNLACNFAKNLSLN